MITPCLPMLATAAQPFNSDKDLFEVKWDGVRALAGVSDEHWRLWGRGLAEYTERYPELAVLRRLPAGTVVDGELVVLRDGRPDLAALLSRHQLVHPYKILRASRQTPIRYLLFDILVQRDRSLLGESLNQRRAILAELVQEVQEPLLVFSEGLVGQGQDFFERVVALGHEGIMAKQLSSRYQPGKRSSTWRKIKPVQALACVIVGYTVERSDLHSLLVATLRQGILCYAGQVRCGLTKAVQRDLARRLAQRRRSEPVVACPQPGLWVEPELYCLVQCFGWAGSGQLRYPTFQRLVSGSSVQSRAPAEPQVQGCEPQSLLPLSRLLQAEGCPLPASRGGST
jgi:DNA ligase D-like protein (predicted ligase)